MKNLQVEFFNCDVGPIKDGSFLKVQAAGAKGLGIGDGCFVAPKTRPSGHDQYGLENQLTPHVTLIFDDGTTYRFSDKTALPQPGQFTSLDILMPEDKSKHNITAILLEMKSLIYGHSRSGGGGLSATRANETSLGSAGISYSQLKKNDCITVAISLSDRWILEAEECKSGQDELFNIAFVKNKKQREQLTKKSIELVTNWRSELTANMGKDVPYPTNQNFHSSSISYIPIRLFKPGKPGYVINMNSGGMTEETKAHHEQFLAYSKTPRYIQEYKKYEDFLYRRGECANNHEKQQIETNEDNQNGTASLTR